jgi:hypothetical protein
MNRITTLTLATMALLPLAVALSASNALAQEKQHVSYKVSPANSKYIVSQNVDVGDVPNHIVRVFEVLRTFPVNAPVIGGVKLVQQAERGTGDLIDGNGTGNEYDVFTMDNGDKLFARGTNVVQTAAGKLSATGIRSITGGTGKFATAHGLVRFAANFDPQSGFTESQIEIEYALGQMSGAER